VAKSLLLLTGLLWLQSPLLLRQLLCQELRGLLYKLLCWQTIHQQLLLLLLLLRLHMLWWLLLLLLYYGAHCRDNGRSIPPLAQLPQSSSRSRATSSRTICHHRAFWLLPLRATSGLTRTAVQHLLSCFDNHSLYRLCVGCSRCSHAASSAGCHQGSALPSSQRGAVSKLLQLLLLLMVEVLLQATSRCAACRH
jgi:hypothetical protein